MGDMREDFDALKEHLEEEKQVRAKVNLAALKALNIVATEQSKNVFRIATKAGLVMFYPTSGKWQHRGRTYHGGPANLKAWLVKERILYNP